MDKRLKNELMDHLVHEMRVLAELIGGDRRAAAEEAREELFGEGGVLAF